MASVLIVEDDGLVASQMARTLREAGHLPLRAPDGRTGLEEAGGLPDLILLDLGLPDLAGEEVLRRLRGQPRTANIPILVVTGKTEAAARLQGAEEIGIARILLKPVSRIALRQAVEGALERPGEQRAETLLSMRRQRAELIQRLIADGPDWLAKALSRRIAADRVEGKGRPPTTARTWAEIAYRAMREGLLEAEEGRMLRSPQPEGREETPPPGMP